MTNAAEISPSGKKLGPIGDRIVFENESIRVWIVSLEPGAKQPWHKHYLPYLIIALTEGKSEIVFEDGTVRKPVEKPGDVIWREPGEIHELINRADWKYQNILVEIKQPTKQV